MKDYERKIVLQKLGLNEIREKFLSFFESKEHLRLPSASLVPQNDPSLLLINAGMAPLKPYFTGKEKPPSKRIVTCQKCIRTPDIEQVGKTARHGTFFEMLGNFSFGDYFKKEAITWAWEFVVDYLNMPKDKLWISIYEDDEQAFEIWSKTIGLPQDRIVRLGKEHNFWEHGTGPCGPCSEIYFDRGEEVGCGSPNCGLGCECDRYIEFWNLVFTQFDKDKDGNYNELPKPNIDTGMGLERVAAIMQDVNSLFEVDTIKQITNHISKIADIDYKQNPIKDVSLRVITDHIRSTVFMVSDGVVPSNEGRGYVLRRLLRRAARHGKLLGIKKPFLFKIVATVVEQSKKAYPELGEKEENIKKIIMYEEERFEETIEQGLSILNEYIDKLKEKEKNKLAGEKAFKLYDTYGFPLDLTKEILAENNMSVDEEQFDIKMNEQRERGREERLQSSYDSWGDADIFSLLANDISTEFVGYTEDNIQSQVLAIIKDKKVLNSISQNDFTNKDETALIILDKTPFYGESGGQVGDIGSLENDKVKVSIVDCFKVGEDKFLHVCKIETGKISKGDKVNSKINTKRRRAIARNHTATHLLQQALRNVLGNHVAQAGSLVNSERLRFDFSHFKAMTKEEIRQVEKEVNNIILEDIGIKVSQLPIEEAKKTGAIAFFGEKYGDIVRVLKIGSYSIELCGGTHLERTSQINVFKITGEGAVAAGTRRIEAITGLRALDYLWEKERILEQTANILKTDITDVKQKAEAVMNESKGMQKEIERLKNKFAFGQVDEIIAKVKSIDNIKVAIAKMDAMDMESLRNLGDAIKNRLKSGIVVLAAEKEGKINFIATASKDLISKGIHAGNIIKEVAKIAGGGGGGRPDMAQAGGKDANKVPEALAKAKELIKEQLKLKGANTDE